MTLTRDDRDGGAGDVLAQELAIVGWPGVIVRTLPDLDGHPDLVEGETPGVAEDPVVLNAALVPWRIASLTKASAWSGGPHSVRIVRSAGGNARIAARRSRALLALTMLTFMTVEASLGVCRASWSRARSSMLNPRVVP